MLVIDSDGTLVGVFRNFFTIALGYVQKQYNKYFNSGFNPGISGLSKIIDVLLINYHPKIVNI